MPSLLDRGSAARNNRRMVRNREDKASSPSAGLLRFIVTVAVLAWVVRSFIAQPFDIPSGSMQPTLLIGDYVLVSKWPYGFSRYSFPLDFPPITGRTFAHVPKRGDIVVFWVPGEKEDLIKRVIGLPGDTVELRNGLVFLNGRPLQRQRLSSAAIGLSRNSPCGFGPGSAAIESARSNACLYPAFRETLPGGLSYIVLDQLQHGPADDFPPTRVAPGHLFLMGDNRDDSLDSRFPVSAGGIGQVPVESLVGRAEMIVWSTDGSASYWRPWTWFTALRSGRIGMTTRGQG